MAYLAASAIQTRLREVLEDARGTLRTIAVGTFLGSAPEGESDMDRARAAVEGATAEALITSVKRNASSPPMLSNVAFYDLTVRVRVTRIVTRTAQIDDSARDAIKAMAFRDADVLRQALGFPGNLTATHAGTATGIVSGLLSYSDSAAAVRGLVIDGSSIIETDHRFTCIAQSTPATS